MQSTGWPSSGGGRLVGSLMSLPYELASAEQNFMVPSERQALIWQDLAPQMLLGATLPRWWGIQPAICTTLAYTFDWLARWLLNPPSIRTWPRPCSRS